MAKYQLTKKAVEDLGNIWEYTVDRWSEEQADSYYRMLLETCGKIANLPGLGWNYEGIKAELFGIKVGRHIIFYRTMPDKPIEITRILHERMDLKSRLFGLGKSDNDPRI